MTGHWLLVLGAMWGAARAPRPSSAVLRRAFERNKRNVVEVVGPRKSGTGIIVAESGEILTSVNFVGLNEAKVRASGDLLPARVRMANADLKVALISVELPPDFHASAVDASARLTAGTWIWGIRRSKNGTLTPVLGRITKAPDTRVPFMQADFLLPEGSPVFDPRGRLVAVAITPIGRHLRALPIAAIKMQLAGGLP